MDGWGRWTEKPPHVTVVMDADDVVTPRLRTWSDPQRGVIVAMVRPDTRHTEWLASDLVAALGKMSGRGFSADGWSVAASHLVPWFVADGIEHVVVRYAESLPINQLVAITRLAAFAEVAIWFVADAGTSDNLATFAAEFGSATIGADDFGPHTLSATDRSIIETTQLDADAFPSTIPDDTFLTFLATARKTMSEESFADVLDLFVLAFDDTGEWLDTIDDVPTDLDVARHVSTIVDGRATLASVTTAMRGIQAAAFRAGLLIKLDPRRFLDRMTDTRQRSTCATTTGAVSAPTATPDCAPSQCWPRSV